MPETPAAVASDNCTSLQRQQVPVKPTETCESSDTVVDASDHTFDQDQDVDTEESSDGDNDHSDDEDGSLPETIIQLRQQITFNPAFELYWQYIQALRGAHELDDLRTARKDMAERFPLPEKLWDEWIEDEVRVYVDSKCTEDLFNLFERALQDCPYSVSVWGSYASFHVKVWASYASLRAPNSSIDESITSRVRTVFERACKSAGLNFCSGHRIWDAYQNFERIIGGSLPYNDLLRKLYHRQIGVVSLQVDHVFEEYSKAVESVPEHVKKSYEKTKALVAIRAPLEERIANLTDSPVDDSANLATAWNTLLSLELSQKPIHSGRVCSLFERLLSVWPANETTWLRYNRFLRMNVRQIDLSLRASLRSRRHCVGSPVVWLDALRTHEVSGKSQTEISALFEEGMAQTFPSSDDYVSLILERCYSIRRLLFPLRRDRVLSDAEAAPLLELFERAAKYDSYNDGASLTDASYNLHRFWAEVLAYDLGQPEVARKHWDIIVSRSGPDIRAWQEYVAFERALGNVEHCRKVFRRAVHIVQHDAWLSSSLCSQWVQFERELGTCESYDQATLKHEAIMLALSSRMHKCQKGQNDVQQKLQNQSPLVAEETVDSNLCEKSVTCGQTRKRAEVSIESAESSEQPSPKRQRHPPTVIDDSTKAPLQDSDSTAFVLNLNWKVNEADLALAFSEYGKVTAARLARDGQGRSRGFAYVDFEEKSSVDRASTALNGTSFRGRIISVSRSKPTKMRTGHAHLGGPSDKRSTVTSQPSLFVKGFDPEALAEDVDNSIRKLFEECGKIGDVRVPLAADRRKCRGFAVVRFEDQASLEQALQLNGADLNGRKLVVERSRPAAPGSGRGRGLHRGRGGMGRRQEAQKPRRHPRLDLSGESLSNNDFRSLLRNRRTES